MFQKKLDHVHLKIPVAHLVDAQRTAENIARIRDSFCSEGLSVEITVTSVPLDQQKLDELVARVKSETEAVQKFDKQIPPSEGG